MKPLETYFSEALGQLSVQNTLCKAQIEQLTEQLESVNKAYLELKTKYEPPTELETEGETKLKSVKKG